MKIGLVGFPGSGKTTVFNALTGLAADTGFGSKAGKTNLGVAKVPDERLDKLAELYKPKKTVHAEITFADVGGGGNARGLDRTVLTSMKEVDALCQVLRAFRSDLALEDPDPLRELMDLEAETILADQEIVERRLERLIKEQGEKRDIALLERIKKHLEGERSLRAMELSPEELRTINGFNFLSLKPLLLVLNVDEAAVAEPVPADIQAAADERGLGAMVLSAQVEMEIAQMPEDEQEEFLRDLGLTESARARFIHAAFALLDLITMLTGGPTEVHAWPIKRGLRAPQASGKIHSDMERGFIRAEVIWWEDLIELGSESKCREAGKMGIEGKDYIIRDGDVVLVRFNV